MPFQGDKEMSLFQEFQNKKMKKEDASEEEETRSNVPIPSEPINQLQIPAKRPTTEELKDVLKSSDSQANPAKWTYERLGTYIMDFEASLDEEHEIGARLVSFGQAITFHIQDIGYYGPDIINFNGIDSEGQKVQLIQHISQLSVLLVAMKKFKENEKARRIGFIRDNDESQRN